MTENLVFLGSGASVPFGLPTMKGLVESFETYLGRRATNNSAKKILIKYKDIKENLQKVHENVDLESIFSVLDAIARNLKYEELPFVSNYIISKFNRHIKNIDIFAHEEKFLATKLLTMYRVFVRRQCSINHSLHDDSIKQIYDDFFKTISRESDESFHIYTTNYDRIQETYWEGKEDINDLFKFDSGLEILDIGRLSNAIERIKLVKLHGSLDWFKLSTGKIVRSLNSKRPKIGGKSVEGEQMLYPIQQKDLYTYPWFDIFMQFKRDLSKTRNWIVIGYSFNDEFIRNMFMEVFREKDGVHRIIVVHPRAKEILKKFRLDGMRNVVSIPDRFGQDKTSSKIAAVMFGS